MATWPITLQAAPEVSGYNLTPMGQTIRSDMEVGTARVRRISVARNDQVAIVCRFTLAQLATFRDWFGNQATGLNGGTNWFTGLELAIDGTSSSAWECRFISEPKFAALTPLIYTMSGTLEVR
jgi:hypothetical protein